MNTRVKIWIVSFVMALPMIGCEEDKKGPLVDYPGVPPEITNIQVESLPGAAKISYNFPVNSGILYVVAEYYIRDNEKMTVKSSFFNSTLYVEGFAEETDYTVTLYTVNRSEVRSQGVTRTVTPLKAKLHDVRETLKVSETFGGVIIDFVNEAEKEYIFYTLIQDEETGEWIEYDRLYTQSKNRKYTVRGLEAKPTEFAFYFADKWKNNSEFFFVTLTPLFEMYIERDSWKLLSLSDDTTIGQYSGWDADNLFVSGPDPFFYADPVSFPCWFSVDLGQRYKFSRLRYNQMNRPGPYEYAFQFAGCAPKIIEIWGTNNPTTNWADWTHLATFESIRPSGLNIGAQFTQEDLDVLRDGEEFDFPDMAESYQYIRWKTVRNWGGNKVICFCEMNLWGQ